MIVASKILLPIEPAYVGHRIAEARRKAVTEWLRQREQEVDEHPVLSARPDPVAPCGKNFIRQQRVQIANPSYGTQAESTGPRVHTHGFPYARFANEESFHFRRQETAVDHAADDKADIKSSVRGPTYRALAPIKA